MTRLQMVGSEQADIRAAAEIETLTWISPIEAVTVELASPYRRLP